MLYQDIPAWLAGVSFAVTAALAIYEIKGRRARKRKGKERDA